MAIKKSNRKRGNEPAQNIKPLRLALVWHQHQPYYRAGNKFILPWVWLHATKDYLEMAQHFESVPGMRGTINLVPSLVKQIEEYLHDAAIDPILECMRKSASSLSASDKLLVLENFFHANAQTMIDRSPRYRELYDKVHHLGQDNPSSLTEQDYRDLTIHYALAWTGEFLRQDPVIGSLIQKDRNYTEEERSALLRILRTAVQAIIPLHKKLHDNGQLEISTTPFYHPILPLIIDNSSALEALPDLGLPHAHYRYPNDAEAQLNHAREYMHSMLGETPAALWPSEGSLSEPVLALARKAGFLVTATDEGVLDRSLASKNNSTIKREHAKFFPWKFNTESGEIAILFRDHALSDNIGFTYQTWRPSDAAHDFVQHVLNIRSDLIANYGEDALNTACVSVILDGENCWEYYAKNGFDFLQEMYRTLNETVEIETVTMSEAVSKAGLENLPLLSRLIAGSWINSNFAIWIGHPEDNMAWDILYKARAALEGVRERSQHYTGSSKARSEHALELALEELYIAEGSDWCWWYGDDHHSLQKDKFDQLFRMHVRAAYVHMDLPVPEELRFPIPERTDLQSLYRTVSTHTEQIVPTLSGERAKGRWADIPGTKLKKTYSAMHRVAAIEPTWVHAVQSSDKLILRLSFDDVLPTESVVRICFDKFSVELSRHGVMLEQQEVLMNTPHTIGWCYWETVECELPATLIGERTLKFYLEVAANRLSKKFERFPETGWIEHEATVLV